MDDVKGEARYPPTEPHCSSCRSMLYSLFFISFSSSVASFQFPVVSICSNIFHSRICDGSTTSFIHLFINMVPFHFLPIVLCPRRSLIGGTITFCAQTSNLLLPTMTDQHHTTIVCFFILRYSLSLSSVPYSPPLQI